MKKLVGLLGLLASLAFCGVALASGLIVHNGQDVMLPCNVSGTVIVESGGTIRSDPGCSSTTIQGSLDIKPGGTALLCNTRVNGSLVATQAAAGSYFAGGSVGGANRNDGSLLTSSSCG